jgi:DNA-binding NarL/FixJ family response regulator
MVRILLVEDHPALLKGLRMRLNAEADLSIVGEADDKATALQFEKRLCPDVIVIDVDIKYVDGVELVGAVQTIFPRTPIIILSNRDDAEIQSRAKFVGAAAFIDKSLPADSLVEKIRQVASKMPSDSAAQPIPE